MLSEVDSHRQWFASQVEEQLQALRAGGQSGRRFSQAANFFYRQGPSRGVDLTPWLRVLAWSAFHCQDQRDACWKLRLLLEDYGAQSAHHLRALEQAFTTDQLADIPRVQEMLADCRRRLQVAPVSGDGK